MHLLPDLTYQLSKCTWDSWPPLQRTNLNAFFCQWASLQMYSTLWMQVLQLFVCLFTVISLYKILNFNIYFIENILLHIQHFACCLMLMFLTPWRLELIKFPLESACRLCYSFSFCLSCIFRSSVSIPSKRLKEELMQGSQGLSSSRQPKNEHAVESWQVSREKGEFD